MRVIGLAGAVADPDHVAGRRVPVAGGGIDAGQRLLVAEQQRLVAGVEVGLAQRVVGLRRDADRAHEVHGLGDAVGQRLVALALRAVGDEAHHPAMHVLEAGVAALRESAQKVERRGGLTVSHLLARRIGHARGRVEVGAVDDVAAVGGQRHAVLGLVVGRARLGELAGDAADLHHGLGAGEGQDDRHLQEHAEEVADVVRAMLGEAFGAVPALEQERIARGDLGELLLQLARLTCKNERRKGRETAFDILEQGRVRIGRDLADRLVSPRIRRPFRHCLDPELGAGMLHAGFVSPLI